MPDEPEVHGLLALMLLHDARRDARLRDGELVLLDDQDRALWDTEQIDRGPRDARAGARAAGPRAVRRCRRRSPRCTPTSRATGAQIAALYGELVRLTGSPVVELNRAVAVAEAEGPERGLAIVDGLELDGYHYLHSARADLLRRLGRDDEAARRLRARARARARGAERRFLERRIASLSPR